MKSLSLKLDDEVFLETESVLSKIRKPRNRYINEALIYYNRLQRKKMLAKKLNIESLLVQEESLRILAEFDKMDEDED